MNTLPFLFWTQRASKAITSAIGTRLSLDLAIALLIAIELAAKATVAAPLTWERHGQEQRRFSHTATLLADGRVLVAAGFNLNTQEIRTAELYDPTTNAWMFTGRLLHPRTQHTATLLANRNVLVAGGDLFPLTLAESELYDPETGVWTLTGDMNQARYGHTATFLHDGRVLVAGGFLLDLPIEKSIAISELYDPQTGLWTLTGDLNVARGNHTAALLADGRVLVAGGQHGTNSFQPVASAEVYDPATGVWRLTDSMNQVRFNHSATTLPSGEVLEAGGSDDLSQPLDSAELYDPVTGTWTFTGMLTTARDEHKALLLPNGRVLILGGVNVGIGYLASTELYDRTQGTWSDGGTMVDSNTLHGATLLNDGTILVSGGLSSEPVNGHPGWMHSEIGHR